MKKTIWSLILSIFVVGLVVYLWWQNAMGAVSADKSTQVVVVPKGSGIVAIADQLKNENLIRSSLAFKVYAKLNNLAGKIQAGTFEVAPSMGVAEMVGVLSRGTDDIKVTLVEGWRNEEMANRLQAELGINADDFLSQAKVGYMFPDTYFFPNNSTAKSVVSTLRNNFDTKYTGNLQSKIKAKGLTPEQGIILASIVEREARSDMARTEVASILLKRLKIGMPLDADSTVQYALGYQPAEESWWKRNITAGDKTIASSYNTYLHSGLPPAPICNPSLSSLEAVVNANFNTPYLYYYHDSEGNSYYAKTLDEQNSNVANHP